MEPAGSFTATDETEVMKFNSIVNVVAAKGETRRVSDCSNDVGRVLSWHEPYTIGLEIDDDTVRSNIGAHDKNDEGFHGTAHDSSSSDDLAQTGALRRLVKPGSSTNEPRTDCLRDMQHSQLSLLGCPSVSYTTLVKEHPDSILSSSIEAETTREYGHCVSSARQNGTQTFVTGGVAGRWHEYRHCAAALSLLVLFCSVLIRLQAGSRHTHAEGILNDSDPHAIFVAGGGFSGFWYMLGRLRSIRNPSSKTYYCYSAGCLGVVSALNNFTVDEMSEIAFSVQNRWKTGIIHRYDVVGDFLDKLLPSNRTLPLNDARLLSQIRIITTVKDDWFGVKAHIRVPKDIQQLREMLLQSAWIPFVLGRSLWHVDSETGMHHMDGAFSTLCHPRLANSLNLPFTSDILLNIINVNLSKEMVEKLWNAGLVVGIA